ncbi:MAG: undecaprenyl/decaprenyl-phosphate alpha-N-acetylglucosaminyl 1-phosphate transferase [Planctomycetes bacterium]|nr:undecaprenyl/decaprenyl-phosphate alpha-N-acetylglucosaminyl 1-phosphate transferase [Planctomycetota bacterium]
MELVGLGVGLLSFLLAVSFTPVAAAVSRRRGFVDPPGPRKIHDAPMPIGGGIALCLAGTLPLAGGALVALYGPETPLLGEALPPSVAIHLAGAATKVGQLAVLIAGGLAMFGLGLLDDARRRTPGGGLSAPTKLLVQTLIALGLVAAGVRATLFFDPAGPLAGGIGGAVTVLWVLGITNAINLLDHADGLAAGVTAIVGGALFIAAVLTGQFFIACAIATLAGAAAGFLCWNFPPARCFMGDSGSLFLGYWLAALTVLFTFYQERYALYSIAVPIVVLAVPIFDTLAVIWLRFRQGAPILVGDRQHLSHRLTALGMSPRRAILTVYLLTAATGIAGLTLYNTNTFGAVGVFGQTVLVLVVLFLLEASARTSAGAPPPETPPDGRA